MLLFYGTHSDPQILLPLHIPISFLDPLFHFIPFFVLGSLPLILLVGKVSDRLGNGRGWGARRGARKGERICGRVLFPGFGREKNVNNSFCGRKFRKTLLQSSREPWRESTLLGISYTNINTHHKRQLCNTTRYFDLTIGRTVAWKATDMEMSKALVLAFIMAFIGQSTARLPLSLRIGRTYQQCNFKIVKARLIFMAIEGPEKAELLWLL